MLAGPTLTVDLAALTTNYRILAERFTGGECASVVKADAYGLGVAHSAPALLRAGCRSFFVATLEEGIALRRVLPEATLYVFHGPYAGEEKEYAAHALIPVINSPEQLMRWLPQGGAYALHVDSGINRLGFSDSQFAAHRSHVAAQPPVLVMSHFACANEPQDPKNREQLVRFHAFQSQLPGVAASLCNSSGIFLKPEFHFQLARPGCALYGINPTESSNPMRHVATLSTPIMQIRTAERADTVGYSATYRIPSGARLAIAQLGYADGYLRALSNVGHAVVCGARVPIAGRVSMDMIVLDISSLSERALAHATCADFISAELPVDAVAAAAHTIGYEVFTRIGARVKRVYVNG